MGKKLVYSLVVVSCLIGSYYFYFSTHSINLLTTEHCAFCDAEILNRQKFYEDECVVALYTHKPILPGHCLIIPKRHVERFEMLSDEEMTQIGRSIKKVNRAATQLFGTSSYLLLQKNGAEVGQTVPHVHFHYIPRKPGDGSTLKFLVRMYIVNAQKPIAANEMQEIVKNMKNTIQSE